MRVFQDETGGHWLASVREAEGTDYKGRYQFHLVPEGGSDDQGLALTDIRWNTRATAERTLRTMSTIELRRRLHSARGRKLQVS